MKKFQDSNKDLTQLKREIQYMVEGVENKVSVMDKFDYRLQNIEKLLMNLNQRQPGGKTFSN